MLRNRTKRVLLVLGLAASALLPPATVAAQTGQGAVPMADPVPDALPRMWTATARYVYADDSVLAKNRPILLKQLDSTSLKAFGASLKKSVEGAAPPSKSHLSGFQKLFDKLSGATAPARLAVSLDSALTRKKAIRTKQASFQALHSQLDALASAATSAVVAPAETDISAVGAGPPASAGLPAASSGLAQSPPTSPWTWVALGLSVLSLLVAFFKPASKSKNRHHSRSSSEVPPAAPQPFSNGQFEELRTLVRTEVGKVVQEHRARATPAAPPAKAGDANDAAQAAPQPEASPVAAVPPPAVPVVRTLYANQQPVDGLFQRDTLAGAPASYTIFELTIDERTPTQARFGVTGNAAGHAGYIGSHQNILGGACTYAFPQGGASRIVTEVPGTAQLTPGGDWQIVQKARIRFD